MKHNKIRPPGYPAKPDPAQANRDVVSELDDQTDASMIAENITVCGDLCGNGTVLVHGTVIGKIILNDGAVTVTRKGTVKGLIQADTVHVSGSVEGNIIAKKCLRLEMAGCIIGDVTVNSFIIEDGGIFNGQSKMIKSGEEPIIIY